MIIDRIERLSFYESVLPQAEKVAELLKAGSPEGAPFEVRVKKYDTKPDDKRRFEVHAHTIDLMVGLVGEEIIHVCPESQLEPAEFLPGGADGRKMNGAPQGSAVVLQAGMFVALYPGEAHMVGGQTEKGAAPIEKWVVKLPVNP